MLKNVTLGQFFPGNSFLHRLDPRMKLMLTLLLIVVVFVSQGFVGLAVILGFVAVATRSSGISPKIVVRGLKPVIFIVILTFILNVFFQNGGNEIFRLGFVKITDEGLTLNEC